MAIFSTTSFEDLYGDWSETSEKILKYNEIKFTVVD